MESAGNIVVEVAFQKQFASKEVAKIYRDQLRAWLEDNIPTYLWPDSFHYFVETLDEYDTRHGPRDYM